MTPTSVKIGRLVLFGWLCALSLLLLPLIFTGVPTKPLMVHLSLFDAMNMRPTSQAITYDWTASFVLTRLAIAIALFGAAISLEILYARRCQRIGDRITAYYFVASCTLLAYLTFGLLGFFTMIVVV